jgi:hypothetical protein
MGETVIQKHVGKVVVIDLESPYVVIGTLVGVNDRYFELADADIHDLRDSETTREAYVADVKASGVPVNRKSVLIPQDQAISIAALDDVVS